MAEITIYCTVDDVQRWVKRIQFSETTKVTPSDVNQYIQMASNILDGELRKLGITLPVNASSKVTVGILKTLVSFEAASMAEQSANYGANAKESTHGKWLHDQYVALLESVKSNPCMLSDIVATSVRHMKSSTEDMIEGGTEEGNEIFTKQKIDDFRDENKISSPSEHDSNSDIITGQIPRDRI